MNIYTNNPISVILSKVSVFDDTSGIKAPTNVING